MAEAIAAAVASDTFTAYSAGTEIKDRINPDAVATILSLYGTDITKTQRPKLLGDIPPVDIVVTMGCNVDCPFLPCAHREDWGLEDPSDKGEAAFRTTAEKILGKVMDLKVRIQKGEIDGI